MTFQYVLKEVLRAKSTLDWYLSRGWTIVGSIHLGDCESYIMKKGDV